MKREPFLLGALAGIGIFYILKKFSPKKRSKKTVQQTHSNSGDKV
jgi:hypothetical protein